MPSDLERASNNNMLWPPIADAVDTFLRRRQERAGPYERAWRLIHIWESVEVTLAVAVLSRLCTMSDSADVLRRIRAHFYGSYWDEATRSFQSAQGAANGSIDQWITILEEIPKQATLDGVFLPALKAFLEEEVMDLSALVAAWMRACDVPPDARTSRPCKVKQAMRHVNSLRNRLAHVPFPHDPLQELADALEAVTQQLFGIAPRPSCHEKDGRSSPLTGALQSEWSFLHGTHRETLDERAGAELQLVFPMLRRDRAPREIWRAGPFLHLDTMVRPHVLTRVKDVGTCEYTRFRAEANALLIVDSTEIEALLPHPKQDEYEQSEPSEEQGVAQLPPAESVTGMESAIDAVRRENYDAAIPFFEGVVTARPSYHVGWLRLGHAQREKAVRMAALDQVGAVTLLREAVASLQKATEHLDAGYRAQAFYELSKAFFHLSRLEGDTDSQRNAALDCARTACRLHGDPKYLTWLEYVERSVPLVPSAKGLELQPRATDDTADCTQA